MSDHSSWFAGPAIKTRILNMAKTATSRRYQGGGPRPDRNVMKRDEAKARKVEWDMLGHKKQLKALDDRLGVGVGAKRQRARLKKLLQLMSAQ